MTSAATIPTASAIAPKRIGRPRRDPAERFWPRVDKGTDSDSCWNWLGAKVKGYGFFYYNEKQGKAYRFSYEQLVGPIPEGLTIDHLCKNPSCVRPDHLEAVTLAENLARSDRSRPMNGEHQRIKTHCPSGHEYTPENTRRDRQDNARYCLTCRRLSSRARRARLAQLPLAA